MDITSKTKIYCIFGNPVSHSISPVMHNAGFSAAGLDAAYCAFAPDDIGKAVESMRSLGIAGASVTIPFKTDVINYIDETDELVRNIGAANTLVNKDGIIRGCNTDGIGACAAIVESGIELARSSVLIAGNGGSARAIAWSLLSQGCKTTITGRNTAHISSLALELNQKYSGVSCVAAEELTPEYTEKFDIIINATPVGMEPDSNRSPFGKELLHSGQTVFDIVYKPDKTALLALAEERGCKIIRGFEMLLNQGIEQFKLWTGLDAPKDIMRSAAEKFLHGNL
ncbi:MAG: shikimate dehydrogenase [Leptospirales bacterium]|nr:shikimate dehydrogenase [Leptospirales bacterium]